MGISKDRISSPLEAGTSLLDSQKLPPQLNQALDYVSDKLMNKHLHLTLIVVRHDTQVTPLSPAIPPPSPSQLLSPSSFSKIQPPSLPGSPKSTTSSRSSSPFSPTSPTMSSHCMTPQIPNPYGISLHHASTLSPKTSRHLQETITKASKKYSLGTGWLSPTSPTTLAPTHDLIHRSLQQNDVLFSSEGLTLLSLDRIYTFKLALSAYTRSLSQSLFSPSQEEKIAQRHQAKTHCVDELRLLVLSQNGRRICQSYLLRAYDHLSFSVSALHSVNEAYKTRFLADGVEIEAGRPLAPNVQLLASRSGRRMGSGLEMGGGLEGGVDGGIQRLDMGPHFRAPATPGGYEEVTPVTRGEWSWLMGGQANLGTVRFVR